MSELETVKIGVIGGSGLYKMPEITDITRVSVDTPFGAPSADIVLGTLRGKRVAFLPRHGEGHVLNPSEVPYRANIYALKSLGVRFIISANACGSLREAIEPGHLSVPSQLYDMTKSERGGRTFFENGVVAHISVADPFSPELATLLANAADSVVENTVVHRGGTFVIIEGPRFSTRGESEIFRQLGCSIIGMTACPEAFLAREAEIAYATIAHITDYDVWHQSEEPVTVEMVVATMHKNVANVQKAIAAAIEQIDIDATYPAHNALDDAIMTAPGSISQGMLEKLGPIVQRRFSKA